MGKVLPLTSRTSSPNRILISCAGVGMGNASRVIAVVEALIGRARTDGRPLECHIVTWGSAYTFLKEYKRESEVPFELIEAHGYGPAAAVEFYSPRKWFHFAQTYARNVRFLREQVKRLQPDLILLDSDYHFPAYLRAHCPIVYIGQASDVVDRARRDSYRPEDWREHINFYLKEKLDLILQRLFSNWVLVPSFTVDGGNGDRKVKRIPLIVRKEFLGESRDPDEQESVGILLSGSELEKSNFLSIADKFGLKVLSPGLMKEQRTVPSHAETLDRFDIIFTQGGLSSISECIARSKFLVVFPMRYHPEQLLNAAEVEQLGLGMSSRLEDLDRFPELLERIRRRKTEFKKSRIGCNGAEVAAHFIFNELSHAGSQLSSGQ